MNFDKDKAYMEVLCKFRELLDTEFRDGGWLPGTDIMSQRFGVSRGTYLKAVKCLVLESMVTSYPRKGIYIVPKKFRCKKIGLVVGDGRESPFLSEGEAVAKIIQTIHSRGYHCQFIQASPMSNIPRSAVSHCVTGLLWFAPPKSAHQLMSDICEQQLLPLIVIRPYSPICDDDLDPAIPGVGEDITRIRDTMTSQFEEFGHRRIAYVGDNTWLANRLESPLMQPEDIYSTGSIIDAPGLLIKKIMDRQITGIWLASGMQQLEIILRKLNSLPRELQPDVLINNNTYSNERGWYPAERMIGITETIPEKLCSPAVNMLIDNLDTQEKITPVQVPTFRIVPGSCTAEARIQMAMS